jgi:2'-5' RNA ligase
MHGLVSLLDSKHHRQVESLWELLEEECGLTGIKVTPFPHFSWLIASDFDWLALESTLREIASRTYPFTVRTAGLGMFSGFNPVVFIPLVRTAELSTFHRQVWESIQPHATDISPLYNPGSWIPHITLAYDDVTPENIPCVMQILAFQAYNWELHVDNISFIRQPAGQSGQIQHQFEFKGGKG